MRFLITTFILVIVMSSCGNSFRKLMHNGYTSEQVFFETIPFSFDKRLPLIDVEIQGKTYQFLFDTGAPNVISEELAGKIDYKQVSKNKINDSQGNSNMQKSVLIDDIKIGNINFKKMGALIIDYNKVFEMRCFEFDGIIGANLMSKAAWQIDYEKSEISFTNDVENFDLPEDALKIDFIPKTNQRTPTISVKANEHTVDRITFDTGATGALQLRRKSLKGDLSTSKTVELKGATSTGVYGRSGDESTTLFAVFDSLIIGDLKLKDQIVEIERQGSMIIGNKFLKNFRVVLDWKKNEIFLIENTPFSFNELREFGFYPRFKDNTFVVSSVFQSSLAHRNDVQIGDQIVKINGVDYNKVSEKEGCDFLIEKPLQKVDSLELTLRRNDEIFEIEIAREILLSSKN